MRGTRFAIFCLLGAAATAARASDQLEGAWDCGCWEAAGGEDVTETTSYAGGVFHMERTFSIRSGCDAPDYTFEMDADYRVGGPSSVVQEGLEVDYTWKRATMTPLTTGSALAFRVLNVCGISDWKQGEERDVLGKSCDGRNPTAHGPVSYNLVGFKDGAYSPGSTGERGFDGSSPAERPRRLDTDIVCRRRS